MKGTKEIVGKLDGIPIVEGDMNVVEDNEYYLYRGQDLTLYKRNQQNRGINILDFPKTDCWVSLGIGRYAGTATGPTHIEGCSYIGESASAFQEVPIEGLSGYNTSKLSLIFTGNKIPNLGSASALTEKIAIPPKTVYELGMSQGILSVALDSTMEKGAFCVAPSYPQFKDSSLPWVSWDYSIEVTVSKGVCGFFYAVLPRVIPVTVKGDSTSVQELLLEMYRGRFKNIKSIVFYDPEKYPNGYLNALEEQFKEQSKQEK